MIRTITEIKEDVIKFSDGSTLYADHEQDCCEHVWADFNAIESLAWYTNFEEFNIEVVEGSGFRLNGFFVPCYDEQNGYYSSNLSIYFKDSNGKLTCLADVSEGVKECHY